MRPLFDIDFGQTKSYFFTGRCEQTGSEKGAQYSISSVSALLVVALSHEVVEDATGVNLLERLAEVEARPEIAVAAAAAVFVLRTVRPRNLRHLLDAGTHRSVREAVEQGHGKQQ